MEVSTLSNFDDFGRSVVVFILLNTLEKGLRERIAKLTRFHLASIEKGIGFLFIGKRNFNYFFHKHMRKLFY